MTRIRIILAGLPGLLRDVLGESLAAEPDFEIVGNVDSGVEIAPLARTTASHVVVVGDAPGATTGSLLAQQLRSASMPVTVIAIGAKGDRAVVFPPNEMPVELLDLSTGTLTEAIRSYPAVKGSTRLPPA
ncbi:MAG: hypothetical protein ABJB66_00780 [Gemmatimonadaceae bacterium]